MALQRVRVTHIAVTGWLDAIAERVEGVVLLVEDEGADVRVLRGRSVPASAPVPLTLRRVCTHLHKPGRVVPLACRQAVGAVRVRRASHGRMQVLKPRVVKNDVLRRVWRARGGERASGHVTTMRVALAARG